MDTPPDIQEKRESGVGPIVGIIIIVAVFLIGGVYFLLMGADEQQPVEPESQAVNE